MSFFTFGSAALRSFLFTSFQRRYHDRDARRQQQVSRATTNESRPARDSCEHGHLSLMNRIKAVYLTRSFLIAYMRVRYSLLHYLLLLLVITSSVVFQFLYITLAVDKMDGIGLSNTVHCEHLPKKVKVTQY